MNTLGHECLTWVEFTELLEVSLTVSGDRPSLRGTSFRHLWSGGLGE